MKGPWDQDCVISVEARGSPETCRAKAKAKASGESRKKQGRRPSFHFSPIKLVLSVPLPLSPLLRLLTAQSKFYQNVFAITIFLLHRRDSPSFSLSPPLSLSLSPVSLPNLSWITVEILIRNSFVVEEYFWWLAYRLKSMSEWFRKVQLRALLDSLGCCLFEERDGSMQVKLQ